MIQVLPNESNNPRNQHTLFACYSDILQQNSRFFNTFLYFFYFSHICLAICTTCRGIYFQVQADFS
mgnify:FL=1